MLVCFSCKNHESFSQVAADRAGTRKERTIVVRFRRGPGGAPLQELQPRLWRPISIPELKQEGLFCQSCKSEVTVDPELAEYLSDKPAAVLDPADFRIAPITQKIRKTLKGPSIKYRDFAPRRARWVPLRTPIHNDLKRSLERQGLRLSKLYSHQVEAIEAALNGKNVVIATSAASGKTLCFNIPVLNTILSDPDSRALYIYPTKALAQDQILKILRFDEGYSDEGLGSQRGAFFRVRIGGTDLTLGKYDGSVDSFERNHMRRSEQPNILLTNPDMLHTGILRNSGLWTNLLEQLRFVVLDEIHTYKGIFGSNVALVMRRLRKMCELNGSNVQFVLCSATVGNPLDHARALTGISDFTAVTEDGSPTRRRRILMVNPPELKDRPNERLEPSTLAVDVLAKVLLRERRPVKTIAFGRSRLTVKNMYRVLNARLRERKSTADVAKLTREYTATLTPEEREQIGKALSFGNLVAVIGTNALELGIDIGDISTAIAVGYPGSTASILQEFGRAGRRGEGLGLLILQNNALEQYYARHPEEFFSKHAEDVRINPRNKRLLAAHLACCAYECEQYGGMSDSDFETFFGIAPDEGRKMLDDEEITYELIRKGQARLVWKSGEPAYGSLRNPASKSNFDIICDGDRVGVMDDGTVIRDLHPGAVWTSQDVQYLATHLDFNGKIARVARQDVDYYTIAMPKDQVEIEEQKRSKPSGIAVVSGGDIRLRRSVFSYKKIYFGGAHKDETAQVGVPLPSLEFPTNCTWIAFGIPQGGQAVQLSPQDLEGGLHALEHALVSMLPRYVESDPNDISGFSSPAHTAVGGQPAIFVYDNFAGGIGLADVLYDRLEEVAKESIALIESCRCVDDEGCPACVQSPRCGRENRPLSKKQAVSLARMLL